jgi:hypothetical protein
MTKLNMTNFGRVIRDQKLATNDRQIKSGHLYADFFYYILRRLLMEKVNKNKQERLEES